MTRAEEVQHIAGEQELSIIQLLLARNVDFEYIVDYYELSYANL